MQYRYRFVFSIVLFSLLIVGCTSKKGHSFSISGNVPNLATNYIVFSKVENFQTKKTVVIDTLKVNKRGEFNAVYFLEPSIYTLTFDNKKNVLLAIDKGQNIEVTGENIDGITVSGSIDTQLLNEYEAFRTASLDRLVNSVRSDISKRKKEHVADSVITALRELEVENYKKHVKELIVFVKENMGNSIAIYPTSMRWDNENLPFLEALVADFEDIHPTIEITKKLKDRLLLLKKTSVGSVLSTIEMPNSANEIIALNAVKGTYTLIDFWASWCPPCRSESTLLNNLYDAYNSKGFEIYSISLDSNRIRWLNAMEKGNRIWTNVSAKEGFKTPSIQEFGITALPANLLIDSEGKIIAVKIHGEELKEKITGLFTN